MGDAASPKWLPETGRALLTEDELSWSIPTGLRFISFILEGKGAEKAGQKKKKNKKERNRRKSIPAYWLRYGEKG